MSFAEMGLALLASGLMWLALAILTGWDVAQFMGYLACGLGCLAEIIDHDA